MGFYQPNFLSTKRQRYLKQMNYKNTITDIIQTACHTLLYFVFVFVNLLQYFVIISYTADCSSLVMPEVFFFMILKSVRPIFSTGWVVGIPGVLGLTLL